MQQYYILFPISPLKKHICFDCPQMLSHTTCLLHFVLTQYRFVFVAKRLSDFLYLPGDICKHSSIAFLFFASTALCNFIYNKFLFKIIQCGLTNQYLLLIGTTSLISISIKNPKHQTTVLVNSSFFFSSVSNYIKLF